MTPRVLVIDIETSPGLADVWKLWDNNVSLTQLRQVSSVIGVGYKWLGERQVYFASDFHDGHAGMIAKAWDVLNEATEVIHYNGTSFDIPHLQREFLLAGLGPTSPFKENDLLKVVKKRFRFMSNKLDHVSDQLGTGHKKKHEGHELWVKCLAGDEAAWKRMAAYCRRDVRLTERLHDALLGWNNNSLHQGLFDDSEALNCPRCGSTDLEKRGTRAVSFQIYQQYQCRNCKGWLRGTEILGRAGGTRAL